MISDDSVFTWIRNTTCRSHGLSSLGRSPGRSKPMDIMDSPTCTVTSRPYRAKASLVAVGLELRLGFLLPRIGWDCLHSFGVMHTAAWGMSESPFPMSARLLASLPQFNGGSVGNNQGLIVFEDLYITDRQVL